MIFIRGGVKLIFVFRVKISFKKRQEESNYFQLNVVIIAVHLTLKTSHSKEKKNTTKELNIAILKHVYDHLKPSSALIKMGKKCGLGTLLRQGAGRPPCGLGARISAISRAASV